MISALLLIGSLTLAATSVWAQVNLTVTAGGSTTFIYSGANGSCVTTAPTAGNLRYAIGSNCAAATHDALGVQTFCGCCPIFNGDCIRYTNTSGAATSDAFVIGGITYNVTINGSAPTVTTHPANAAICESFNASFTASASGAPTPTVQWQRSTSGGSTWTNIAGATNTTYTFMTNASMNGHQFRAVFTNARGTATTNAATLTIKFETFITSEPQSDTLCPGSTMMLTTTVAGTPTPALQWQLSSDDGSTWTNITGATGLTLDVPVDSTKQGYRYRQTATNSCGTPIVHSAPAILTVATRTEIAVHPTNQTVCQPNEAMFRASATAIPTPSVQWQVSTDAGSSWSDIAGATGQVLFFSSTTSGMSGNKYRAIFSDFCYDSDTTTAATLTVNTAPVITTQPLSTTFCENTAATFSVAFTGQPTPTVQWQISTNGGTTWLNINGYNTPSITFNADKAHNGNLFRAVVSNACGTTNSNPATLTVHTPTTVTTHPDNVTVCAGSNASFTATATASSSPTVQWQISTNGGGTWINIAGATSTTLTFTTIAAQNGNQFRARFSNTAVCGGGFVASNPATLTVNTATNITSHPSNMAVCAGSNASFTVAFTGNPTPTVQWQISTNGGVSWINIAGATNPTLTFVTVAAQNNNQFRAVLSSSCSGSVTSNAATLTVNTMPAVTTQPGNMIVCAGSNASFTAIASGTPAPTVQWQISTNGGGTWINIAGANTSTLTFTTIAAQNGNQFRAVFSNSCGTTTSNPATLTVNTAASITSHPSNAMVCAGSNASFTVAFTGQPTPTVQWQISTNGGTTWINIAGATNPTLTFVTVPAQNGNQFRAVLSNSCGGQIISAAATLTINTATAITTHPSSATVCEGASVSFSAAASGSPAPTVQWQESQDGGATWTNIAGATSTTLSFSTTAAQNGNQYRAVFSNSCGAPAATNAATLTVNTAPVVTAHLANTTVCAGSNASFTVAFIGQPSPNIQWQISTNGGVNWINIAGATNPTLTFVTVGAQNGNQFRARLANECGTVISNAATLTVNTATTITAHPSNVTTCAGSTATFTATANGNPAPTVQWQESQDGGATWTNIAGATSTTLSFSTTASQNGNQYRAVFSNSCGAPAATNAATLTVNTAALVTAHPTDATVCEGQSVSFSAAASGSPAPTVQWQISLDGGVTWTNIAGATSTTLSFVTTAAQNGNQFRAIFSNACGTSVSTSAATLTANAAPVLTANPTDVTVCEGANVSFTAAASGSPAPTVQWELSADNGATWTSIAGATSVTYSFTASASDNGNQYRATFGNVCGSVTSTAVTVTVHTAPVMTAQPAGATACTGQAVTFTAAASGTPAPTVQWQVSADGGITFVDMAGETSPTLTLTASTSIDGNQYRAVFTSSCGMATSAAATLTVNAPPSLTASPSDATVCEGASVSFTAAASGTPAPTVQWEVSADNGATWTSIAGATSATYSFAASASQSGNQYRATFGNVCGSITSPAAMLTVNAAPTVTANPSSVTLCAGATATFTAAASGIPAPTVQWQVSADNGTTWTNIAGATSTSYSFTVSTSQSGNQYRAMFGNVCGVVTSSAATLSVHTAPVITLNPVDQVVCGNTTVTFTAAATATPAPTVQWQVSTNNGTTWTNIAGATSTSYSFTATAAQNNNLYRAVFSNVCNVSVATTAAKLTLKAGPTISLSLSPTILWPPNNKLQTITATISTSGQCGPLTVTLDAIVSDEGDEANDVAGASFGTDDRTFQLRAQRDGSGDGRVYTVTYTVTDAAGNTSTVTGTVTVPHNQGGSKHVVTGEEPGLSDGGLLQQNVPNPFAATTEIGFSLEQSGEVNLTIFNLNGKEVATLVNGPMSAGAHMVRWDGMTPEGAPAPTGMYIYTITTADGSTQTQSMMLIR